MGPRRWPTFIALFAIVLLAVALGVFAVSRSPEPPSTARPTHSPFSSTEPVTAQPSAIALGHNCPAVTDGRTYLLATFFIRNNGGRAATLTKLRTLMPLGGLKDEADVKQDIGRCGVRGDHKVGATIGPEQDIGFSAVFRFAAGTCPYPLPDSGYLLGKVDGDDHVFPYSPFEGLTRDDFDACRSQPAPIVT